MREIKFRAWDAPNSNMIHKVAIYGHAMGTSVVLPHGDYAPGKHWKLDSYSNYYCDDGSVIPLQYTGLKDKKGVEIYEGDILRIPANSEYEKTTYNSFEVFYHDNDHTPTDCGLVLGRLTPHGNSAGGYSGYKLIPKHIEMMEVIGNIYENPHLINPTEQENK